MVSGDGRARHGAAGGRAGADELARAADPDDAAAVGGQRRQAAARALADPERAGQVAARGEPDPLAHPGSGRAPDAARGGEQVPGPARRNPGRGHLDTGGEVVDQQLEGTSPHIQLAAVGRDRHRAGLARGQVDPVRHLAGGRVHGGHGVARGQVEPAAGPGGQHALSLVRHAADGGHRHRRDLGQRPDVVAVQDDLAAAVGPHHPHRVPGNHRPAEQRRGVRGAPDDGPGVRVDPVEAAAADREQRIPAAGQRALAEQLVVDQAGAPHPAGHPLRCTGRGRRRRRRGRRRGMAALRGRDGRDPRAAPGDGEHAERGQNRRPAAPSPDDTSPEATPQARLALAFAGHPERDIFHGDTARRLGGDPVQHLRQLPLLGVHEATPPVMSSASPGASRSRASAFDACAFTAPTEQPIAAAVCASV